MCWYILLRELALHVKQKSNMKGRVIMDKKSGYFFDRDKCTKCGACKEICPAGVIAEEENGMCFREGRLHLCIKCGHCMSVCPTASAYAGGFSYEKDLFTLPDIKIDERDFINLITTRRAVRNFKDTPVPKELLEKIVEAISYAPPGFTPVKTEIIVVHDPAVIKKALPYMVDLYEFLLKKMKNPIVRLFIKKDVGKKKFKQMQTHMIPLMTARLPALKNGTEDTITRNAPAMILFHSDKNEEDLKEDLIIAATYCMLAAHSMGLGGSIMALIPPAINKKEELRKLFGIPDQHEVLTSVILGYPKYKYKRGIKRVLKNVKWI